MKCNEIEILIMEYFDGALKKERLDNLLEHFSQCKTCEEEFNSMKAVLEAVESLPQLEPEAGFVKNVMMVVEKRKWKIKTEQYFSSVMWAAALFAFMIITRDFFTNNISALTSNPAIASLFNSAGVSTTSSTSVISVFGNLFSDLPGKFSVLLEKVYYLRAILLSEYLTVVIVLVLTFILANLGLGKMFFGKEPNRRPV